MAEETMERTTEASLAEIEMRASDLGEAGAQDSQSDAGPVLANAQLGLWALLGTLTMLFAGFTSAYLVRRVGPDWQRIALPPILWVNTGLLLCSSITLETARSCMKRGNAAALRGWLGATTLLGVSFLGGQLVAWRQLVAQGIYVPTSPHSSFFYMLTGVHGVHLLGGIVALFIAFGGAWRSGGTDTRMSAIDHCAVYWHFVDGLWLYLFVLMFAA